MVRIQTANSSVVYFICILIIDLSSFIIMVLGKLIVHQCQWGILTRVWLPVNLLSKTPEQEVVRSWFGFSSLWFLSTCY